MNSKMDKSETFLELPLDRELYKPKVPIVSSKPPLRVLITEAAAKISYNIIYAICSGQVFGPDQEIILHLMISRGSQHQKAIVLELEDCGFSTYKDYVLTANPAVAYKKVDIIIVMATYEQMPGRKVTSTFIYQIIKYRQVAKYAQDFASKDVKLIFTGPCTKSLTIFLGFFKRFASKIPNEHITCQVYLDLVICKAEVAAKLKITTDRVKNIMIRNVTFPDIQFATVRMYPKNDRGATEMIDIPLEKAVQDKHWLSTAFTASIYRRVMNPDLLRHGKAVAMATIAHLKILFGGSDKLDEIATIGVITQDKIPSNIMPGIGFSFPVETKDGVYKILQNIPPNLATHLNELRVVYNIVQNPVYGSILKITSFMLDYEIAKKKMISFTSKYMKDDLIEFRHWTTKYFITPNPSEGVSKFLKDSGSGSSKKSIFWNDDILPSKKEIPVQKSSIRFEDGRKKDYLKEVLKTTDSDLALDKELTATGKKQKYSNILL